MNERAILPFCGLITLYYIEMVAQHKWERITNKVFLSGLSLIGIAVILSFSQRHVEDVSRYRVAMTQTKIIIPKDSLDKKNRIIGWSIPYETLLISSIEGPENRKRFIPIRKM